MATPTERCSRGAARAGLGRCLRGLAPLLILAAGLVGFAVPAEGAGTAVVVDAFGNPTVAAGPFTRSVAELPAPGTSTTPQGSFSVSSDVATMTSTGAGNGVGGTQLTYRPSSGSVDLTGDGNNNQILVDFSEIEWPDAQPGQSSVIIYSQATDTNGCTTYLPSDGIANYYAFNAAFPFSDYSASCDFDWSAVTSFQITFTFSQNYSPGTLTVQVNRIWATPETANPPSNPTPAVTAPATAAGSSTTPLDFTIAFTSDQGAAPVTYDPPSNVGLRAQDLQVSGTAFDGNSPNVTVTGGPATYTAVVTGMAVDGTVTLHVPTSIVEDAFLQYNSASVDDPTVAWTYSIPPDFETANATTFTVGTNGSFVVSAMGGSPTPTPAPVMTIQSGRLPTGVTFTDNGNGTATMAGAAATGAGGVYDLTLAATNAAATVTQRFTLSVDEAPSFTSAGSHTFIVGTADSFSVSTDGYPDATITESGAVPSGLSFTANGNGTATVSGDAAAGTGGVYDLTLHASNGVGTTAAQSFSLVVDEAPAITSGDSTTFTVGAGGSFGVSTSSSAHPVPSLTESGALPSGVTFVDDGNGTATLAGTPTAGSGGVYSIDVKASNGVGAAATQDFTLTVDEASGITSGASATFGVGIAGTFTVTTGHGYPTPPTISMSGGTLPSGVSFTDNGNGTAMLSGTPSAGSGGTYAFTVTATNGVGTPATQHFTLTVDEAPAITSSAGTTFTAGAAVSFTLSTNASAFPTPSLSESGALPSGVTFVDNGDGTAALSGTPGPGTGGTYAITVTAQNGVGTAATQDFTLTVGEAAGFTSAASTTFKVGSTGSFRVTTDTTSYPAPTLREAGALPSGVRFIDHGNGTATLSGTPAERTGGLHSITITASNGVGTAATQDFTLTVDEAPVFTSTPSASLAVGSSGTVHLATTAYPPASLHESGKLPTGVTFTVAAGGKATISGRPAADTGGVYDITVTAQNGVSPAATQHFHLSVDERAAITSVADTAFVAGRPGSFTVTSAGLPLAIFTESGKLPAGVRFRNNGDGTATLWGSPARNTGGVYRITITATNRSPGFRQRFTLTVDQAPSVTSAPQASFRVGADGSFVLSTNGFPIPSVTESGTLPAGLRFSDHGNGTATISGTPSAGTAGTYVLTVTASNGVVPKALQHLSLTVNGSPAAPAVPVPSAPTGEPWASGWYWLLPLLLGASGLLALRSGRSRLRHAEVPRPHTDERSR